MKCQRGERSSLACGKVGRSGFEAWSMQSWHLFRSFACSMTHWSLINGQRSKMNCQMRKLIKHPPPPLPRFRSHLLKIYKLSSKSNKLFNCPNSFARDRNRFIKRFITELIKLTIWQSVPWCLNTHIPCYPGYHKRCVTKCSWKIVIDYIDRSVCSWQIELLTPRVIAIWII